MLAESLWVKTEGRGRPPQSESGALIGRPRGQDEDALMSSSGYVRVRLGCWQSGIRVRLKTHWRRTGGYVRVRTGALIETR